MIRHLKASVAKKGDYFYGRVITDSGNAGVDGIEHEEEFGVIVNIVNGGSRPDSITLICEEGEIEISKDQIVAVKKLYEISSLNANELRVLIACGASSKGSDHAFGICEEITGSLQSKGFNNYRPEELTVNQVKGYLSALQKKGILEICPPEFIYDHGSNVTQFILSDQAISYCQRKVINKIKGELRSKKLTFKQPAVLEITEWYDEENDKVHSSDEKFKAGETIEVDIIDEDATHYKEIQFGDGSVAYNVPKKIFKISIG